MVLITETSFSLETDPGSLDQERHYTIRCNVMQVIFSAKTAPRRHGLKLPGTFWLNVSHSAVGERLQSSCLGCGDKPDGRMIMHELHALDSKKLVVTRPAESLNEWKPQTGLERKGLPDAPASMKAVMTSSMCASCLYIANVAGASSFEACPKLQRRSPASPPQHFRPPMRPLP